MSLRLLFGGSGQGKTKYIMDEVIARSIKNPLQKYYVMVPEQYSLQMQRDMILSHPKRGFFQIDVESFFRLSYLVFDECSVNPGALLEDVGVSMILKKILTRHEDELLYFKRSAKKQGFLDELKSMLMEFISYGITPGMMSDLDEQLQGHHNLSRKCKELAFIYQCFQEEIENQYLLMDQAVELMTRYADQSQLLKDGIFYLDGFTGFTPIQLKFLEKLLVLAKEVVCCVTIPYNPLGKVEKEELFHFSEKNIEALVKICKKQKVEIEDPILLSSEYAPRYKGEELAFLEKHFLHGEAATYQKESENIHIISCLTPEEEAAYILHKAEDLVRSQGIRYREMAILTGDETSYLPAFTRQAESMGLPLFIDASRQMSYQAGVESIRALFHLAQSDYSYESVFRYLKSGMSNLQDDEIDFLENYVLQSGIRGASMWKKPLYRRISFYEEEEKSRLEELRQQFVEETYACVQMLQSKKKNVEEKLEALEILLLNLKYKEKFEKLAEDAAKEGKYDKQRIYEEFYDLLEDLIKKTKEIFGEEYFSPEELSEIMDAGLEALGITVAPLSMDQLVIGDMKRTRLPEVKILFIAGLNDGYIPAIPKEKGLINDDEKEILEELGISLSMTAQEQILENEFYMYLAFCKPQEAIYFTFAEMGNDGVARKESQVISELRKLFPKIAIKNYPENTGRKYINWQDSRAFLCDEIRNYRNGKKPAAGFLELLHYGISDKNHSQEVKKLWDTYLEKEGFEDLEAEIIQQLYGQYLYGSVTRLENFMQCPYQYYCRYGLGLEERAEYKVSSLDYGNTLHAAMEYFSKKVKESPCNWKNISTDQEFQWEKEALEHAIGEKFSEVLSETARNRHIRSSLERLLHKTIEITKEQLKNSDFEPDHFELRFGEGSLLDANKIPLTNGNHMVMHGQIDRLDIYEEEDQILVKIIDYKSGNAAFDMNKVYQGLQMQLIVYMNAALESYQKEKGKKIIPAGIYYYHMKDPIFSAKIDSRDKQLKEFKLDGLSNSDPDILRHIEDDKDPISIDAKRNKDGSLGKRAKTISTEEFYDFGEHTRNKLVEIGNRIYQGEIDAAPYTDGKYTACGYCKYKGICAFDPKVKGYQYREFHKLDKEVILDKIRKQVD